MRAPVVVLPLALALACASTARAEIAKGPYLQHLGADRVEIKVELGSASPVVVEYGAGDKTTSSVESRESKTFHDVALTGLTPKTRYHYRVRAGADAGEGDFVTAPGNDSDAPFAFAIYGDNRTDTAAHAAVVRGLTMEPFDFLVNSGDFVQQGGEPKFWRDFFAVETPLLRGKCMFGCIGNHELFSDSVAGAYGRYFGPSGDGAALYGSFRWGSARFFLLNAFQDFAGGDERAWLERELTAADAEPGLRWRFAVIHHSPWSGGPHGANQRLLAAGIPALLVKHKVDLVIAGHDHIYERGEAQGLKYLISGGGGAPLYRDINTAPSTLKIEASYHYVIANVTADAVKLVAKRVDGSLIERVGFAHGSWGIDSAVTDTTPATSATPRSEPPEPAPPPAAPKSTSACGCRAAGAAATGGTASLAIIALALMRLAAGRARRRS